MNVTDITRNADTFRAAYPNWPHPEPERETVTMMNEAEAREFRAAHDADAVKLTRMSKARVSEILGTELARQGITRLYGTYSKDELISEVLRYRYPPEQFNETTHVLYHKPGEIWDACEFCKQGGSDAMH